MHHEVRVLCEDHHTIEVGKDLKIHIYSDSLQFTRRKWSDDGKTYSQLNKVMTYDFILATMMDMT